MSSFSVTVPHSFPLDVACAKVKAKAEALGAKYDVVTTWSSATHATFKRGTYTDGTVVVTDKDATIAGELHGLMMRMLKKKLVAAVTEHLTDALKA